MTNQELLNHVWRVGFLAGIVTGLSIAYVFFTLAGRF